jgi:hypothetical protein
MGLRPHAHAERQGVRAAIIERRVGQFRGLLCALKESGTKPGFIPPSLFSSLCEVERGLQLSGQRLFTTERIPGGNSRAHGASVDDLSIAELRAALEQKRKDAGIDAESLVDTVKNMMVNNARC